MCASDGTATWPVGRYGPAADPRDVAWMIREPVIQTSKPQPAKSLLYRCHRSASLASRRIVPHQFELLRWRRPASAGAGARSSVSQWAPT